MFSFGIWLRHMKTKNRNNLFKNSYYQRSTILVGTHKSLFSPSFWQAVLFVGSLRSSRFLSFSRRKSNKRANKWACERARLRWAKNWGEVGREWAGRERVTRGRVRTTTTTSTASTTSGNRDDPAYRFTRHAALDYCELFWYWTSMLWSIDACNIKVCADLYHVSISWVNIIIVINRELIEITFILKWTTVR